VYPGDTGGGSVDNQLQPVEVSSSSCDLSVGDFVHCRVVLGTQQIFNPMPIIRRYFIFALTVDKVILGGANETNTD